MDEITPGSAPVQCGYNTGNLNRGVIMWHMKFMSVGISLVDAASDGKLTLEEVAGVLADAYPDHFEDLLEEVKKANEDGHYSVSEIFKILAAAVL